MSEAVSCYSVEEQIAGSGVTNGNSHVSDTGVTDTYHQARRDYDVAGNGDRAQAFITMLVAERVFTSRFGLSNYLQDYQRRYSP